MFLDFFFGFFYAFFIFFHFLIDEIFGAVSPAADKVKIKCKTV